MKYINKKEDKMDGGFSIPTNGARFLNF